MLAQLTLCHGAQDGFIWSIDTANSLRNNHRILGKFNNEISRQNEKKRKLNDDKIRVRMPFILNRFEIRLLFEMELISIIHKCLNNANHEVINSFFKENNSKRIDFLKEKLQTTSVSIGEKRKLDDTDIVNEEKWNDIEQLKIFNTKNIINKLSQSQKIDYKKIQISPLQNDFVLIPNKSFNQYLFKDIKTDYKQKLFWSKIFNFKLSSNEFEIFNEKYEIYKDLYNKKFYVLLDRRFSGNFIVYDETPITITKNKIHSKYIIHIISKFDKNYKSMISLLNKYCQQTLECNGNNTNLLQLDILIMSYVRIAVNVNKQILFAYIDTNLVNQVKYYIVKWHYNNNTEKEMWYQFYNNHKL